MKKIVLFAFIAFLYSTAYAQIKVACIGNSITAGSGIKNRDKDSYPSVLNQMLGKDYLVRNFGISGRIIINKGDNPYMKEKTYRDALKFLPDIVIIKLGTNDSKPQNWKYKNDFKSDLETMIQDFQDLSSQPKIYLCTPAKAYGIQWGINDSIITKGIIPIIRQIAQEKKLPVIDIHTATDNMPNLFPDKIHPNPEGAIIIAETVYENIKNEKQYHTMQAFPGIKSKWERYDRYDFKFKNRNAIVVVPQKAAPGNPWIWRPAFFAAFPSVDIALLAKGFHVAYYDLTHLYGSPHAVKLGTEFCNYMRDFYQLSSKVTVEGFSRGGFFAFNWAAQNTDRVACLYVDAPLCDLFLWPGRDNKKLWNDVLKEWNLKDNQMTEDKGKSIYRLKALAEANIPIISVCGDSDEAVPFEQHMNIIRKRYLELGVTVRVITKLGCGHHPHSLTDPTPIVNFILKYTK